MKIRITGGSGTSVASALVARGCLPLLCLVFCANRSMAQPYFEEAPIRYSIRSANDPIAELQRSIQDKTYEFTATGSRETLETILELLDISPESQILVFSKTSLQNELISPETPRALYFNDSHYVGWAQGGDIEVAASDRRLGLTFYQITPTEKTELKHAPDIQRNATCLICHAESFSSTYPGLMAHSVFATEEGTQLVRDKSYDVDHRTPIEHRWGGWYVTGRIDGPRHRGNVYFTPSQEDAADITATDIDRGSYLEDLNSVIDTTPYLRSTSDVLALLVFEHQIRVKNQILNTYGETKHALRNDPRYMVGKELSQQTNELIESSVDDLLDAMLSYQEVSLEAHRIEGSSAYKRVFQANARRDDQGRSLKDFDLNTRVFAYRCSYLIYSDSFMDISESVRERFFEGLMTALSKESENSRYAYIPNAEKEAIYTILKQTHPDAVEWPEYPVPAHGEPLGFGLESP